MSRYKIEWETDGLKVNLPRYVDIPSDVDNEDKADWLSDKYGWLVKELTCLDDLPM